MKRLIILFEIFGFVQKGQVQFSVGVFGDLKEGHGKVAPDSRK